MSRRRNTSGALPRYDEDSAFFTLAIHHKGLLVGEGSTTDYVDGDVAIFENVDSDSISMEDIYDMLEEIGVTMDFDERNMRLWWCIPKTKFCNGARRLKEEKDLQAFISYVRKHRFLKMYVEEILSVYELCDVVVGPDAILDEGPLLANCHVGGTDEDENNETYTPISDENTDSEFEDSDYEVREDENLAANFVEVEINSDVIIAQPAPKDTGMGKNAVVPKDIDSDYAHSDELGSVNGESDEECNSRGKKFASFNPEVDMENPVFKVGMYFASMKEFKDAIKEYAIRNRVNVSLKKNDLTRVMAYCKGRSGCPWELYGRWISSRQALQVRKLKGEHTCVKEDRIKWVTFKYIAKRFMSRFEADPTFSLKSLAETCQREMGLKVHRSKLSRARIEARKLLHGEDKQQYARLWDYAEEIRHQMSGSTVYIIPRMSLFDKMYICFDPCKRGFLEGCRPIIFLDGCHIKIQYGGRLLTAVGIDANDCIYPIAIAPVEVEDRATWKWFLNTLKMDLNIENTSAWTLMTDRQKGLIAAVEDQFNGCEHRFCVRHMYQNFQAIFAGEGLKRNVWTCARSSFPQEFEDNMEEIKRVNLAAWEWLSEIDKRQWTRAHFREFSKCDALLNNISECFNKYILNARGKTMLEMLETIRCQVMKRLYDKHNEAHKFRANYIFCPKIINKLNKIVQAGSTCWADPAGALKYQVKARDGMFIVDLNDKTCTCRRWQLTGIPCCHSIPAICQENMQPQDMLHDSYSLEMFANCYKHFIQPLRGPRMWTKTGRNEILPPVYTKKPGRPKKSRRKSAMEIVERTKLSQHGIAKRCTKCGELGHNKRTCLASTQSSTQGGVRESQASSTVNVRMAQTSTENPSTNASPAISSQFMTRWMPDGSAQVLPIPLEMPPPSCVFLSANAPPAPRVPLTTATKRGRDALSQGGTKKRSKPKKT